VNKRLKEDEMNVFRRTPALSLICCLFAAAAAATGASQMEKLKSLAGDWEGKTPDGKAIHASYKLVSGGSAIAETLTVTGEPEMLTVYHANGGGLMMTHYCSMGNQPRMKADAGDGKTIAFHFVDGTNMSGPDAAHMNDLTITFDDANHITQEWAMKGGPMEKVVFHLQRTK
jgi:hypothetical protein